MNFTQWRAAADRGEIRRVTWVCGGERVLVEEIVDTIRTTLKPEDMDYLSFYAGETPDKEIWAAANQYPFTNGTNYLVLVRGADRIQDWKPLEGWLENTRYLRFNHLLFVSNESDFPYELVDGKKAGFKPHIEALAAKRTRLAHLVRCGMPNEKDAVAWVRSRAPLDEEMAQYLLTRVGGNLGVAANVCSKLAMFTARIGPGAINALCAEAPSDDFVDSLLASKKRQALLAAKAASVSDYRRIIGLLDSRLDLLTQLNKALRANLKAREIQGISPFLVRQYLSIAKDYNVKRSAQLRRVLAVIDDAVTSGARDGVLEALVALW